MHGSRPVDSRQIAAERSGTPTYVCQMTQTPFATTPLAWWDPRQYIDDYLSGNVTLGRLLSGLIYWAYYSVSQAGIGVGRPMRWLYDQISPIWGGPLFPRKPGVIPDGPADSVGKTESSAWRTRSGEIP